MEVNESGQYRFCGVEDHGHVRIVTIKRPEVRNALHDEAGWELERVWNDFAARDDLWVGIVTGEGAQAFSAGNDLKAQASGRPRNKPKTGFGGLTNRFDLNKPLIAAVNGFAMGGGFEMALVCDIVIASENAVFALPEARVGLFPAAGGVYRLPRALPQKIALGLMLTAKSISAAEAKALGLVNEVVAPGMALEAARRWADQILQCSPMAVRAVKEAVYLGLEEPSIEKNMSTVYPAQKANQDSADYIEGPKAFAEKRAPRWQNK